jgi:hypothetical protein
MTPQQIEEHGGECFDRSPPKVRPNPSAVQRYSPSHEPDMKRVRRLAKEEGRTKTRESKHNRVLPGSVRPRETGAKTPAKRRHDPAEAGSEQKAAAVVEEAAKAEKVQKTAEEKVRVSRRVSPPANLASKTASGRTDTSVREVSPSKSTWSGDLPFLDEDGDWLLGFPLIPEDEEGGDATRAFDSSAGACSLTRGEQRPGSFAQAAAQERSRQQRSFSPLPGSRSVDS